MTTPVVAADELVNLWPHFPYAGLRPFASKDFDESLIFFGRNRHKDDVLDRLHSSQLVSVIGPSGCGKSSLVKVGVIPALRAGLLTRAGYGWRTCEMRPGSDPLGNLAAALSAAAGSSAPAAANSATQIRDFLQAERSALWLLMDEFAPVMAKDGTTSKPRCLLLLVDQFEELFSGTADPAAVDQFLGILAQFFRKPHPQLYVALTMRTDFVGQCASFPGLAEILNETQYITPVLRGDDLREAIARPAEMYCGDVEPELIEEIVRDMGAGSRYDADNLPLMQHALLWLWRLSWDQLGVTSPPRPGSPLPNESRVRLTLSSYLENGGLSGILERHAEAIFHDVENGPDGQRHASLVEVVFRRLSERDTRVRYKRAPALLSELSELTGCDQADLKAVLDPFVDASFIERRLGQRQHDPLIDISHESLIRQWSRLKAWADDEADKVAEFRKLVDDAVAWHKHLGEGRKAAQSYLKTRGHLAVMNAWWDQYGPTPAWAHRYRIEEGAQRRLDEVFPTVEKFRNASADADFRIKAWMGAAYAVAAVLIVLFVWFRVHDANLKAEQASKAEEVAIKAQESRTGVIARTGERLITRRSQSLALNLALELADPHGGYRHVKAVDDLLRHALENLHELLRISVSQNFSASADFSPDGRWLATVHLGRLLLVDEDGRVQQPLLPSEPAGPLKFARWNPAANQLLLGTTESSMFLLTIDDSGNPAAAIARGKLEMLGEVGQLDGIGAFSNDGRTVATYGSSNPVRLWDAATGKLRATSPAPMSGWGVALSPDGRRVAVLKNGNLLLSEEKDERLVPAGNVFSESDRVVRSPAPMFRSGEMGQINSIAFHPTHPTRMLIAHGSHAKLVETPFRRQIFALEAPKGAGACSMHRAPVRQAIVQQAFSADGRLIVTSHQDGTLCAWSGDTGEWVATFKEHQGKVFYVRFSPDGRRVVSGGSDNTIRVWSVDSALERLPSGPYDAAALAQYAATVMPKGVTGDEAGERYAVSPIGLLDEDRCDLGLLVLSDSRCAGDQ